jgi:hypothetical protein
LIKKVTYYEELDGGVFPYWFGISFEDGDVDWTKDTFYFDIEAPFERAYSPDLDHQILSVSVDYSDILRTNIYKNKLGINLNRIKQRALEYDTDVRDIQQFLFLFSDIEEILNLESWKVDEYASAKTLL